MVKTQGLTHIHLAVHDLARAVAFYQTVFGMVDTGRGDEAMVFLRTPGRMDTLTLRIARPDEATGAGGGVDHFGFRLAEPGDLDDAVVQVIRGGGRLIEQGEHAPGVRYAYVADPEGYVIEL